MSTIGPTFLAEITAAGLNGLPFSWDEDGVYLAPAMTDADRARVQAVVKAHDPTKSAPAPPDTIEGKLLIKALTDAQYVAIKPRDQARIAADPSIPVGNALMVRAAAKAGIAVPDWVAAARAPD